MGPPIFIGGNLTIGPKTGTSSTGLQWGRRFSSAEIRRKAPTSWGIIPGFNGAADFHRRKFLNLEVKYSEDPASMGPPIFIGGNIGTPVLPCPSVQPLQWGRRFSSAEIGSFDGADRTLSVASMGPPIFIGGNAGFSGRCCRVWTMLQWAADFHRRKFHELM